MKISQGPRASVAKTERWRTSRRPKPRLSRKRSRSLRGKTSSSSRSPGPAGRTLAAFIMVHAPSAPEGAGKGPRRPPERRSRPARQARRPLGAFVPGARNALRARDVVDAASPSESSRNGLAHGQTNSYARSRQRLGNCDESKLFEPASLDVGG